MGYPKEFLSSRSRIKKDLYAIIPKEGLVNNVIPGIEGCKVSIVASPKMGAGFVQYVVEMSEEAQTTKTWGVEEDIETFIYCIQGGCTVTVDEKEYPLTAGGYVYSPAGLGMAFKNESGEPAKVLLYKQVYMKTEFGKAYVYAGNVNEIAYKDYDNMETVHIKDLLPVEIGFDMNMHILAFEPGSCHPFVETHVQEHGAYILEGEGLYLLDNEWIPVKKDDFLWMGAYVTQAGYGIGQGWFTYIYSKDCNRDIKL
jgi:(S)-ureidoglycine aminohydrolase